MRLATYNVEWFANLFDDDGRLLDDGAWSGRQDVTRADQIAALGRVFQALDADAILVVEAPDSSRHRDGSVALETFAAHFELRCRKALIGFANHTQQEIILLYDPDRIAAHHDPGAEAMAPQFDGTFRIDLDIDAREDRVTFSKPPLEAALDTELGPLRLIGVHVKSKAPHGAKTPEEAMQLAISNRRKQLAQCIWLRRRIETHLAAGDPLLVMGDLNDGPGLDVYEELFGRSSVEIVMGLEGPAEGRLYDPHALRALQGQSAARPATARFYIAEEERYLSALLDYAMISQDLRKTARQWRIWHPFDDPLCYRDQGLCQALQIASDHYPLTVDFISPASKNA